MYKSNFNGVTVNTIFDTRRKLSTGLYPVRIIINYRRERRSYPTGISLTKFDWERLVSARDKELVRNRKVVQDTFNSISSAIEKISNSHDFTFERLNRRLGLNIDSTIDDAYKAKIEKLNNEGKHNTADTYKSSLQSLIVYKGDKIKFSSVTVDYLSKYEKFMRAEGKSFTTISIYLKNLKAIMNEALREEVINLDQFPFGRGRYQISNPTGRKMALTKEDIKRVIDFSCTKAPQRFARDLWVFSYLCNGANFADIFNLKFENIKEDNIEFYRQKTINKTRDKQQIVVTIHPIMRDIIKEWGNAPEDSKYIFPILNGTESSLVKRNAVSQGIAVTNFHMKEISKVLGINKITTYAARHSFATILKRSGINIAYISESLGHSNLAITENYLAKFEDEERKKNSNVLTDFC